MAKEPNCGAVNEDNELRKEPIGVRVADTINTSSKRNLVEVENSFETNL
jgi:hypothetical protein